MSELLVDASQLNWLAADDAAKRIQRICLEAAFVAPENLLKARDLIVDVCEQLDAITKALLITPPGVGK